MSAVGLQLPLHGVCGLQPMSNSTTPSKKTPSTPAATNAGNAPSALSTAAVKQSGSNRLFVKTLHCRHATRYGRWAGRSAAVSAGAQSAIPQPKGKVGAGVWVPSPQENYRQRHSHKRTAAKGTATRGLPTKGQLHEELGERRSPTQPTMSTALRRCSASSTFPATKDQPILDLPSKFPLREMLQERLHLC